MGAGGGIGTYFQLVVAALHELAFTLGGTGLFLIALADSSFLSIPEGNDVLIVVLSTGQSWKVMSYFVLMTIAGSVAGCSLLYWTGRRGGKFIRKRFQERKTREIAGLYQRWGLLSVMVPSLLPPPTPFKIFVLAAGLFRVPFPEFLLAVGVGRSIRYFLWGILAVLYGELAAAFLAQNIYQVGIVLFVLFVGAMVGYLWIGLKARKRSSQQGRA